MIRIIFGSLSTTSNIPVFPFVDFGGGVTKSVGTRIRSVYVGSSGLKSIVA